MFQVKLGVALWDEEIVEGVRVIGEHSERLAVVVNRARHVSLKKIQGSSDQQTCTLSLVQTLAE